MHHDDYLLEIGCEELPPKALIKLAENLAHATEQQLQQAQLGFESIRHFATPRRLAVLVTGLDAQQPSRDIERQGPNAQAAFDKDGTPTLACLGFAKSCGVTADQLQIKNTPKGRRVVCRIKQVGSNTTELLPEIITNTINSLSFKKPMRWGNNTASFVRPVHWLVAMYGNAVIPATVMGTQSNNQTYGHRYHHPTALTISQPQEYETLLEKQGYVIADIEKRRTIIATVATQQASQFGTAKIDSALLDEVTAMVEWPVILTGQFKSDFLAIPDDVLITSMQVHQKYFPIVKHEQLCRQFIIVSNIASKQPDVVIAGNERVLNARLADAAFFYHHDCQQPLADYYPRLEKMVFQQKLGTLADKTQRLERLVTVMAKQLALDITPIVRSATLAKCDLVTDMVGEFPELQGIMGYYYALHSQEESAVATAIKEHYLPNHAGDQLPTSVGGTLLALADRLDTIVGIIGINKLPRADKDPFALRRRAVGIIRLLIEKKLPFNLLELLTQAHQNHSTPLPNQQVIEQAKLFIEDRLRAWYLEQGITAQVFAAVAARQPTSPLDFNQRIQAVCQFQTLPEAAALAAANKRVTNILKKQSSPLPANINKDLFEHDAERELAHQIQHHQSELQQFYQQAQYTKMLSELAALKNPVDRFFDQVMVMVEDQPTRSNRLALLASLRQLLTQVADISLLS